MSTAVLEAPPARAERPAPRVWPGAEPSLRRLGALDNPRLMRRLVLAAFLLYAGVGIWLLYGIHFAIGDALARSAAARYAVASRDPHLAAIGFVWLPLPTLAELPFSLLLSPFGLAAAAGPVSTAVAGALTIPVAARLMRALGVRSRIRHVLLASFALNPVTIFLASNGMSEAFFVLFAACACLGYVRWVRTRDGIHLATLGLALGAGMLVRYETAGVVAVFCAAVALHSSQGRRLLSAAVVAVPAVYAMAVWIGVSAVLMHDPLFFTRDLNHVISPSADASWLPVHRNLATASRYASRLTLRLAPGLLVLAMILIAAELARCVRKRRIASLEGSGLVAVALFFPAQVALLLSANKSFGNPRYFFYLVLAQLVLGAWLLRDTDRAPVWRSRAAAAGVLLLAAASMASASVTLANPRIAAIDDEPWVFGRLFGTAPKHPSAEAIKQAAWRKLAADLDGRMRGRDLVATDTYKSFPTVLYSHMPERFVIPSDRDFGRLLGPPSRGLTYLIVTDGPFRSTIEEAMKSPQGGGRWVRVGSYQVADLFHLEAAGDQIR